MRERPRLWKGVRRNLEIRRPYVCVNCRAARRASSLAAAASAIIASFAREEDAFLLESELADLDQAHGIDSGKCEVLERKTGRRLGGYMLTSGQMLVFLCNENDDGNRGIRRRK